MGHVAAAFLPFTWAHMEDHRFAWTVGFTGTALGSVAWVALAVTGGGIHGWTGAALLRVGAHSSATDLWHVRVAAWGTLLWTRLAGAPPGGSLWAVMAYLGGSVAAGWAASRAVEQPVVAARNLLWDRFRTNSRTTAS
jgi:hypothetical protein